MKKLLKTALTLSLFYFLPFSLSYAQNLVPNPSFEQYDTCPDNENQIHFATGWKNFCLTPDYYNTCAPPPFVSVPDRGCGYQYPATGNAYAGLFTFWGDPFSPTTKAREYISIQLTSPLQIGTNYDISFKTNLGKDKCLDCASDKIGILFSTIAFDKYATDSLIVPSLLRNYAHLYIDSIITDTMNWITISGSFIADSSYQYLILGNFFDDANTDTLHFDTLGFCFPYYNIDDVYVGKDTSNGILQNNILKDVVIYSNNGSVFIKSTMPTKARVEIYNLLGHFVDEATLLPFSNYSINFSEKANGIYLIRVTTNNAMSIKKIFINK